MKILFLSEAIAPHIGRWQEEFTKLGWETLVASCDFTENFGGRRLKASSDSGPLRYISIVDQIQELIKEYQPHLVNAHFLPTYGFATALANVHPLIVTLWGSDVLISSHRSPLHKLRSKFVLKKADLVVADAECLIAEAAKIAPIERRLIVSFGVKQSWYDSGQARELKDVKKLKILSSRKFEKVYDVETLLKAAKLLKDESFPFELELVGSGSHEGHLKNLSKDLALTEHVRFAGYLNAEQLFNAYRNADVYVSTAVSDSTSVSLLEAMSQKTYPVVTDIPGNREWLSSEANLFAVKNERDLADKIKLGLKRENRQAAYDAYEPLLRSKGLREEQMRVASLSFQKLIDEFSRR